MEKQKYYLNRKDWDAVRKMDHARMSAWVESVYRSGFSDGNESAEGLTLDELRSVILSVRGIGEKKAAAIAEAVQAALGDGEDAGR